METEGTPVTGEDPVGSETLFRLITGYPLAQLVYVAARLCIADMLVNGPRNVDDLAVEASVESDALFRVLSALTAYGVFARDGRVFRSTPSSSLLRKQEGSLRATAMYWGAPWIWDAWRGLLSTVRTGQPAFNEVHGVGFFEYLALHPEASQSFDALMTTTPTLRHSAVAEAYELPATATVVDVGGGEGAMLTAILRRNSGVRGVLLERPGLAQRVAADIGVSDVGSRVEVVGGDFFAAVPEGGDVYILSSILHDWPDEAAGAILRNCRRAMATGAKLLVVERLLGGEEDGAATQLMDVAMLVLLGGRERSAEQFADLFAANGFKLGSIVATGSPVAIVEAIAA